MPLSQFLFSLEGRIPRSDFWLKFHLPVAALSLLVGVVDFSTGGGAFMFVFSLVVFWPAIAVGVKRLHDRDKSGWMLLLLIIPLVGTIWFFIDAGCLEGTPGTNRHGPDPKGRSPA